MEKQVFVGRVRNFDYLPDDRFVDAVFSRIQRSLQRQRQSSHSTKKVTDCSVLITQMRCNRQREAGAPSLILVRAYEIWFGEQLEEVCKAWGRSDGNQR
jgi:hypothetical protein